MAVYTNDLRLKEIATGDESGTWGTSTNTNLSLIADAFSFGTEAITTNADTHTTTIADGAADPGRSIFLKYTGTLDSACTITIGPNTVSKLWLIENATSGSQNIIIKQGSGATITIANGQTKAIYSDGAGSGGAMVDAFQDLSIPDLFIDDDLTIGDDLLLSSDSAVISFGADADVTLTHIHNDGLRINSNKHLQFGDGGTYIHQSADGVLDLVSDTEIEINATLIDINGNADVSGTVTATGTSVFASLDISGDIDVDGTTNLDVVDIDGAVDMASTLQVDGAITSSAGATITTADNSTQLTLKSTDADANLGPILDLLRDGGSPADSDFIGQVRFQAKDDGGNVHEYAKILGQIADVTGGTEDGILMIRTVLAGTDTRRIDLGATETVINEDHANLDFRVEGDSNTHMIFVDASTDRLLVGKSSTGLANQGVEFEDGQIKGTATGQTVGFLNRASDDGIILDIRKDNSVVGTLGSNSAGGVPTFDISSNSSSGIIRLLTSGSEAARIDNSGNIQFAGVTSNTTVLSLNTSDGSDSKQLSLAGGGADSDGRGARIRLMGNEHASLGGDCDISTGNASGAQLDLRATGSQIFTTASVEHMKLDGSVVINESGADLDVRVETVARSSGFVIDASTDNAGFMVTPVADSLSSFNAVQFGQSGMIQSRQAAVSMTVADNVYRANAGSTGYKAIVTGASSMISQSSGQIDFYTNASASAGADVTLAKKMTIFSNEVRFNDDGADNDFRIESTGFANQFVVDAGDNAIGIGRVPSAMVLDLESQSSSTLNAFRIRNSSTAAAAAVKMHFSLNRTGSDVDFEVASIVVGKEQQFTTTASTVDGYMAFHTIEDENSFEKMRLNSFGMLLINATSNINSGGGTREGLCVRGGGGGPHVVTLRNIDTSGGANQIEFQDGDGDVCGAINSNATNNTTAYGVSSDYRLKENVSGINGAIEKLKLLEPRTYNFISDPSKTKEDGFIAHELAEVIPNAVMGEKDAVHDNGEMNIQQVDYAKLTPLLTAALQEAITKIETLETEIAALKGG